MFVKALDRALASFNVQRQAYYGGTFVGNHVHRCLKVSVNCTQITTSIIYVPIAHNFQQKPQNNETLCSTVTDVAEQHAASLLPAARAVAVRFRQVFTLFESCHCIYDSSKMLEDSTIDELGENNRSCNYR